MDENATKALYIAVTIFIVMLTLGFVVAYFNTARKAGNLAILGSAVAENYEKLLNSDLDKTEMTGVEVINMLRKYGGKYLFALGKENNKWNLSKTYVMPDRQLVEDLGRESELDTDIGIIRNNNTRVEMDRNKNIPTKFLETINPNMVYTVDKIDRAKLNLIQEEEIIFCGVDLRFNIYPKDSTKKDYAFISPETEVYVSEAEGLEEYESQGIKKELFDFALTYADSRNIGGNLYVKFRCKADVIFSVQNSKANMMPKLTIKGTLYDSSSHKLEDITLEDIKVTNIVVSSTSVSGDMYITLSGLTDSSGNPLQGVCIREINLVEGAIRGTRGQYSKKCKLTEFKNENTGTISNALKVGIIN